MITILSLVEFPSADLVSLRVQTIFLAGFRLPRPMYVSVSSLVFGSFVVLFLESGNGQALAAGMVYLIFVITDQRF